MKIKSFLLISLFFYPKLLLSQLECNVTINFDNIQGTYKDNLSTFASDLENYINNTKWSSDQLSEKIKCNLNVFFTSTSGENSYTAQIFVASQRPIFNGKNPSDKNTILLRIFDDKWEFNYLKNQPLYKNENTYDGLLSLVNFYSYLILGFDYDTYQSQSGTPYFQKAMAICLQGSGKKGWDRVNTGYSKLNLIEEILNPKFSLFRQSFFIYHYKGLDLISTKPEKGFTNIINSFAKLDTLQNNVFGKSILLKTFYDTKYLEFVDVFRNYEDKEIFFKISKIDPSHKITYDEAYKRSKD